MRGAIIMDNFTKWLISIISGGIAAFCRQYGLFIVLVAAAVVLDVVTGLVKAKATGEGLSSRSRLRNLPRLCGCRRARPCGRKPRRRAAVRAYHQRVYHHQRGDLHLGESVPYEPRQLPEVDSKAAESRKGADG